jgi:hypothetical protein
LVGPGLESRQLGVDASASVFGSVCGHVRS